MFKMVLLFLLYQLQILLKVDFKEGLKTIECLVPTRLLFTSFSSLSTL